MPKKEGYFTKLHKCMNSTGIYTTVHAWLHFAVAVVLLLTMSESDRTWCATHWDPLRQNVSSCLMARDYLHKISICVNRGDLYFYNLVHFTQVYYPSCFLDWWYFVFIRISWLRIKFFLGDLIFLVFQIFCIFHLIMIYIF